MTKHPIESWDVRGVQGPTYKTGPRCAVGTCPRWSDHGHHMWSRAFLAGAYRWVRLPDGRIVQNVCALCHECHRKITDNESWIVLVDDVFRYIEPAAGIDQVLNPQPKDLPSFATALQIRLDGTEVPHDDVVREREREEPPCPTCGHKKKRSSELPAGPRRNRASWSVSVPKDERENGADVLDALALSCAEKLGRADHSSWKYYTLAEVMASFALGNIDVENFVTGSADDK